MALMGKIKFPHIVEPTARVRTMRYFMTIFCFLFLVFGIGISACCILIGRIEDCGFTSRTYTSVYLLLGAGCATIFFSLVACIQTHKSESPLSFLPQSIVAIIILVSQVMAAIASHVFHTAAADGGLLVSMNQTWNSVDSSDKECVDALQSHFKCCGVQSPSEWRHVPGTRSLSSPYPLSCQCASEMASACIAVNGSVANSTFTSSHMIYRQGCHDVVLDAIQNTLLIIRIVGPVVTLIEFAVVLAVIYFLHHISNHSLVGTYIVQSSAREGMQNATGSCKANNSSLAELEERPSVSKVVSTCSENPVSVNESIHV